MSDAALLLLAGTSVILCLTLLYLASRFKIVTPANLFAIIFLAMMYVGGLRIFFANGSGASFSEGSRNYTFFAGLNLGFLLFGVGVYLANRSLKFSPVKEILLFRERPWQETLRGTAVTIALSALTLVAIALALVYTLSREAIPLVGALSCLGLGSPYQSFLEARLLFTSYGAGGGTYFLQGYFKQFFVGVLPFVALWAQARFLRYRSWQWGVAWALLWVVNAIFLLMALQRWPIIGFIILTFLVHHLFQFRLTWQSVTMLLLVVALAFVGVSVARHCGTAVAPIGPGPLEVGEVSPGPLEVEEVGYRQIPVSIIRRFFVSQAGVLYSVFELFPRQYEFMLGKGIANDFLNLLPGPGMGFSVWLWAVLHPGEYVGSSSAPPGLMGELYANFSLVGVLVGMLALGLTMQGLFIYFVRRPKTLVSLVLFAMVTMGLAWLSITGLLSGLFGFGLITSFLCVAYLRMAYLSARVGRK